jgi:hypothetical protein
VGLESENLGICNSIKDLNMNSRQRRAKRRFIKYLLRDHKKGVRGNWTYTYFQGRYDVSIKDNLIIFNDPNYYHDLTGTGTSYCIGDEDFLSDISFLEIVSDMSLPVIPSLRVIGTSFYYFKDIYTNERKWFLLGENNEFVSSSFDKVYGAMSLSQKEEAIWNIQVLTG